ncbi:hypothetical protein Tco_1448097 [Tanacetum coccineum]
MGKRGENTQIGSDFLKRVKRLLHILDAVWLYGYSIQLWFMDVCLIRFDQCRMLVEFLDIERNAAKGVSSEATSYAPAKGKGKLKKNGMQLTEQTDAYPGTGEDTGSPGERNLMRWS